MRKLTGIVLSALMMLLTGCAGMNSSFTCKAPHGSYCQPIHEVNSMVDNKRIKMARSPHIVNSMNSKNRFSSSPYRSTSHAPKRLPEKTLRIWVASFVDKQGNLHEPQWVNTVVQSPKWVVPTHTKGKRHV